MSSLQVDADDLSRPRERNSLRGLGADAAGRAGDDAHLSLEPAHAPVA